ncbi:unnamed protein product [Musa hybrid cultivar]
MSFSKSHGRCNRISKIGRSVDLPISYSPRLGICSDCSKSIYAFTTWRTTRDTEIVYKILRCLKRTLGKGLLFRKDKYIRIETSIDVDWARSISDQRSTSGYCTFIGVGDLEDHEADSCC